MPFIAIALAVAVALGGGVSVVAEGALPGEPLWGFKTAVNENIRASIAIDDEAKANWDIEAVQIRLAEAKTLAAQRRLSADAQAKIEQNFEAHAESVAKRVTNLQAEGNFAAAADIAARFQGALAQRISGLSNAQAHVEGSASAQAEASLDALLVRVRSTLDSASELSADASAKAAAQGSSNVEVDL